MRKIHSVLVLLLVFAVAAVSISACGSKSSSAAGDKTTEDKQTNSDTDNDTKESDSSNSKDAVTGQNETSQGMEEEFKEEDAAEYHIAVLKGPTAIGFVKAWDDSDNGLTLNKYNVTAYGAADEITAGLVKGEIDIAAVPCNLASVLYNKTDGDIRVVAINTLGVLYMLGDSDDVKSVADLKGKTIYTTGQGTTPEYTLNYILKQNGLEPDKDVKIEYKAEAAEAAAMMSETQGAIAMLPQPYVSTVLMQNEDMKIVLDMTQEWDKVSDEPLVTGVVVARKEVIEENEKAFIQFLRDYNQSAGYANGYVDETAQLVESHDIIKAAVAARAIPFCNICFIIGDEMQQTIASYLNVLYEANPQSVGGKLPGEDFYYKESAR